MKLESNFSKNILAQQNDSKISLKKINRHEKQTKTLREEQKLKHIITQQALKLCDIGTKVEIQSTGTN